MIVYQHARAMEDEAAPLVKIVVAIHGIGEKRRSETIRAVARRFVDHADPAIPILPLGYFSLADCSKVRWSCLETADPATASIGFAKVFWADIPNRLVRADDTLEETKNGLSSYLMRLSQP